MTFSLKVASQKASAFADDVDAVIVSAQFVDDFDYDGQQDACLALKVEFRAKGTKETFVQHYTAGPLEALRPTNGGKGLKPAPGSSAEGLKSNTNAGKFLSSLVSSGFDDDQFEGNDISVLEGLIVHIAAETQKQSKRDIQEKRKPRTLLLVNQIHEEMPGGDEEEEEEEEKPAKKGKAKPEPEEEEEEEAPKPKAKSKGAKVDPVRAAADAGVLAVLEDNDGKIAASKLSTPLFKKLKGEHEPAMVKKAMNLAVSDEYLEADDAVFDYDGKVITAKE